MGAVGSRGRARPSPTKPGRCAAAGRGGAAPLEGHDGPGDVKRRVEYVGGVQPGSMQVRRRPGPPRCVDVGADHSQHRQVERRSPRVHALRPPQTGLSECCKGPASSRSERPYSPRRRPAAGRGAAGADAWYAASSSAARWPKTWRRNRARGRAVSVEAPECAVRINL